MSGVDVHHPSLLFPVSLHTCFFGTVTVTRAFFCLSNVPPGITGLRALMPLSSPIAG